MGFGTVAFDTLQTSDSKNTGTNKTLDTSYVFNGTPKAWASINEVTNVSIFDSFNLSSTTDDGNGRTDFVLTNVMSNANYAPNATAGLNGATLFAHLTAKSLITSSEFRVNSNSEAGTVTDSDVKVMAVHGDLA